MFVLCVLRPSPASALMCPLSIVTVRLYDWENIRGKSEREGGGEASNQKGSFDGTGFKCGVPSTIK